MDLTLWIVILVPLLIFGWLVAQVMPTPRDRQLVRLRRRARTHDLNVTLRSMPDPDPEAEARVSSGGADRHPTLDVALYALPFRPPREVEKQHLAPWKVVYLRHHPDEVDVEGLPPGWRFEQAGLPLVAPVLERLRALIEATPRGTAAVEGGTSSVALAWRERGDESEVDAIAQLLERLRDLHLEVAAERAAAEDRTDVPADS